LYELTFIGCIFLAFLLRRKQFSLCFRKKNVDMLNMTEELEVEKSDRIIIDKKSIKNWDITILTSKDTTAVIFQKNRTGRMHLNQA